MIGDELTPCRYGFALLRFLHKIAALRAIYPAARILLSKFDFKSAYRRVHFRAESALQSCITTKGLGGLDLALVSLSETVTDLTNAIIRCSDYDPASFPSHYSHLLGPTKVEPDNVPLAAALPLMVDPEADEFGTADVFLDDIFSAIPQLDGDSPETAVPRLPYSQWTSSGDRYSSTAASLYLVTKSFPSTRQSPKAPRRKG